MANTKIARKERKRKKKKKEEKNISVARRDRFTHSKKPITTSK
ncbi:hypothetical protein QG37_06222 [Candidozyma auris]|uniref:Uncharacterized protein n=1 Tax=Candidozyma auris TaxID=498019 RepID=A0A0L0NUE2_CANAR|nr:hypothetical protein QG37_06222 [[Candida] auris]